MVPKSEFDAAAPPAQGEAVQVRLLSINVGTRRITASMRDGSESDHADVQEYLDGQEAPAGATVGEAAAHPPEPNRVRRKLLRWKSPRPPNSGWSSASPAASAQEKAPLPIFFRAAARRSSTPMSSPAKSSSRRARCSTRSSLQFGPEIIRADGTLDRPALAAVVFGHRDRELKLNLITHPSIRERTLALIKAQPASANVVVVVPLLFRSGFETHCDKVVSVVAPHALRVERVIRRDHISKAQVEDRMAAQLDYEAYELRADVVIRNDGDLAALERASNDAWTELTKAGQERKWFPTRAVDRP